MLTHNDTHPTTAAVPDLNLCPWCRCDAEMNTSAAGRFFVACTAEHCTLIGPNAASREGAAAAWNLIRIGNAPSFWSQVMAGMAGALVVWFVVALIFAVTR